VFQVIERDRLRHRGPAQRHEWHEHRRQKQHDQD
jgi:hypothetical protein